MANTRNIKFTLDHWLVITTLTLLCFGLLMVASASMVISDRQFNYPFHYLLHQVIYIGLGVILACIALFIPTKLWQKISIPLMLMGLILLLLVLFPGIGHMVNGSRRWIYLGFLSLQVSEVVKLCALLYLASYIQRYLPQVRQDFMGFLKPMIVLAIISFLLLWEPDFGAVAVLSMMFLALLFIAGVRLWSFTLLFFLVAMSL
jgi:cell division protein FtsW